MSGRYFKATYLRMNYNINFRSVKMKYGPVRDGYPLVWMSSVIRKIFVKSVNCVPQNMTPTNSLKALLKHYNLTLMSLSDLPCRMVHFRGCSVNTGALPLTTSSAEHSCSPPEFTATALISPCSSGMALSMMSECVLSRWLYTKWTFSPSSISWSLTYLGVEIVVGLTLSMLSGLFHPLCWDDLCRL